MLAPPRAKTLWGAREETGLTTGGSWATLQSQATEQEGTQCQPAPRRP